MPWQRRGTFPHTLSAFPTTVFAAPGVRTPVESAVGRYPANLTDEVVLAAVPFFAGLDAPVLTALAESAEEVWVAAGELITITITVSV